jgi:hypothetical protein
MHTATRLVMAAGLILGPAVSLAAQPASQDGRAAPEDRTASTTELREAVRLRDMRYQIGQMERLLEGAVEHGAAVIRDRLRALMPADMLLAENARVRGFRLDGYGMFFDVEVPSLEGTLPWSFRTLDQNDLDIDNAMRTIRSFVEAAATNDINVQQALKRVELQVAPITTSLGATTSSAVDLRGAPNPSLAAPPSPDPILSSPNEAYRSQVREALVDAMLEHSRGLNLGATEWFTVAARRIEDHSRLVPQDKEARTVVMRLSGADLHAFLAGQISREEARKRVDIREF